MHGSHSEFVFHGFVKGNPADTHHRGIIVYPNVLTDIFLQQFLVLESVIVQRMELEEQRQKLYTDYRKAKKEVSEIDIVKANVDAMLHTPQRSEPTRENQIE